MLKKFWLNSKTLYLVLVLMVFAAGLTIRLYDLTDPPLDFHPMRQIHSAIIARGFYAFLPNHMEGFDRDKAWSFSSELWIEPPILEYISAYSYVLAGDAHLWIPRLYSILFWVSGGVGLFLLMKSLAGKWGAFTSILFYLLLPYGIFASRAFQPDPLMVSLIIFTLWSLNRWRNSHSWKDALITGVLAGLAILVKQVAIFFVAGAMAGVFFSDLGFTKTFRSLKVWVIGALALMPAVLYNIYGLLISGFLKTQYALRFFPELFVDPNFYYRWASKINQTSGWLVFLLSLCAIVLVKDKVVRWMLVGLYGGYFLYGMGFAYHISTHDYYQEPLIPIIAIGLGIVVGVIGEGVQKIGLSRLNRVFLAGIVLAGSLYTLWAVRNELKRNDFRDQPALWQHLGKAMNYGEQPVVGLFNDYGARLIYWGYIMPAVWESLGDQQMRSLAGHAEIQKDIHYWLEGKRFFVVTDFEELDHQPDLKNVLGEYTIFEQGDGYIIYDLFNPLPIRNGS